MCDCEQRNHPGSRCGSVNCQCHIEQNAIVNDYLSTVYYFSVSFDRVSQHEIDQILESIMNIRKSRTGMSVFYDTPIKETT